MKLLLELIVKLLAVISIVTLWAALMALIAVMWSIDQVMVALSAVAEFLDYNLDSQIAVVKGADSGK